MKKRLHFEIIFLVCGFVFAMYGFGFRFIKKLWTVDVGYASWFLVQMSSIKNLSNCAQLIFAQGVKEVRPGTHSDNTDGWRRVTQRCREEMWL